MKIPRSYLGAMILLSAICIQAALLGNNPLDFQLRIPLHIQYQNLYTNDLGNFGMAAWNIFSDVTAENNKSSSFLIVGPLWKYDDKGSWLEIMGGYKRNEDGYNDPAIDIRFLNRTLSKLNFTVELAYFPREERRRLYAWLAVDTPIPIGKYTMRLGMESENIVSYSGNEDSLGIGPRLVLPIPLGKILPHLSSSLTTTYQFRNNRDFIRCYLGITYVFRKK